MPCWPNRQEQQPAVRARVVEALGKTTAALPQTEEVRLRSSRSRFFVLLNLKVRGDSAFDIDLVRLALTAVLVQARSRRKGYRPIPADPDPGVRADAANALAGLRARDGK